MAFSEYMNFTDKIKFVGLKRFGDFLAIVRHARIYEGAG
jgi:hypothetical protein